MTQQFKIGEFTNFGQAGFDAYGRSFGEWNKGLQDIAAEWTDYSKKVYDDSTKAFGKIVGAKSAKRAIKVQSKYAKKAYKGHIAEMTKLGGMYAKLLQAMFKPQAL